MLVRAAVARALRTALPGFVSFNFNSIQFHGIEETISTWMDVLVMLVVGGHPVPQQVVGRSRYSEINCMPSALQMPCHDDLSVRPPAHPSFMA